MKVLCFGSLNIDYTYKVEHFVQKGETLSSSDLKIFSGGKGLNQSVALSKAGAETFHAGAVGKEGKFLVEELLSAGVNTDFVEVNEKISTGHAIIQNSVDGDNCILLFGGANLSITRERAEKVLSNFEKGDVLVLQNEISELEYILSTGKEKGMKVVLNPSPIDEKLLKMPLEKADILILNEVEAGRILGKEVFDGEKTAEELAEKFPETDIVLTMGEKGSFFKNSEKTVFQPAFKVKAVDTTAAGDTYTGYFVAGITEGMEPEKAMEFAAKASAIAVTKPGASPSVPERAEVEAFGKEVAE